MPRSFRCEADAISDRIAVQAVAFIRPEWGGVLVGGYELNYIQRLIDKKDPNVVVPIPINLFLFFSAK